MRRYAVLDLQADHHLNADLKDQGGIERRLKKKNPAHTRPGRQTPADSRGTSFFFLTAGRGFSSVTPLYRARRDTAEANRAVLRRRLSAGGRTQGLRARRRRTRSRTAGKIVPIFFS